ncbi:unnamed protein product [Ceutorhynchus assimilis]|uniref:Mitochondrial cardiolipin hydrolase n=1 Tax=Ceutorhynchus assimilis TaxID=467358 RepID=A0A9N9QR15_9CUCU|nr:unnamed protein product [Ceutorhynchus assimilis]
MTKILLCGILLSLTAVPLILSYVLKRKYRQLTLQLQKQDDTSYYECMFFDFNNFCCKPHLINKEDCGENCSYTRLQRLLRYIGSAKKSISMCVYMITLQQVAKELAEASSRGVNVRVITDKTMGKTVPSQSNLQFFKKNGISYKTSPSVNEMMHHKYCLIDEKDPVGCKVFFGSLNLTCQALCKNFEAICLTNNQEIIHRLSEEFEEMWAMF